MPASSTAALSLAAPQVGRIARLSATRRRQILHVVFVLGHVPLAILLRTIPSMGTVHALASLLIGTVVVATTRKMYRVAYVAAYLAGSEVLWRMTKTTLFWEYGKLSVIVVVLIGLARIRSSRNRRLAIAYFALLLPSIALTLVTLDLDTARQELSFNLTGPFALTVCVLFFSNVRLTKEQLHRTFFVMIGPATGIAALSFFSTRGSDALGFGNASNFAASGGFGPNQVSATLGLAVMFLLLMSFERKLAWRIRAPMLLFALALSAQAALTFSRGGLALAAAGTFVALFFIVRVSARARVAVVLVGGLVFGVGKFVIEPRLDAFTGGKLSERYQNMGVTGRDTFVKADLEIFAENPILGVGPGISMSVRRERGLMSAASHTEYSRMLAEHGLFGLLSMFCLFALTARAFRDSRSLEASSRVGALVAWTLLFMAIYGTRLAAPSLVFGLAFGIAYASLPRAQQVVKKVV